MADPFASVCHVLATLRAERVPFADAWPVAVPLDADASVRLALDETRRSWEGAYVGAPQTSAERAAAITSAL